MATYFVNATGTSTPPFNSSATGATNFTALLGAVTIAVGDIIETVYGFNIDNSEATVPITIDNVTIRSWSGNSHKPDVIGPTAAPLFALSGPESRIIGLSMVKIGPNATGSIVRYDGNVISSELRDNRFTIANTSGSTAVGIDVQDKTFSSELLITGNKFRNTVKGVNIGVVPSISIAVMSNYYAQMR